MPRARTPTILPADLATFASALHRLAPMDEASLRAGFALLRPRELGKGELFLRAGVVATEVAVVVRGLLREYFALSDGTERTKAFVVEAELSGSLADLLSGVPSRAFIVAEEPTRVLVGSHAAFRELASRSPAWAELGRRSLEALLLRKAEREYELLGLDAEERYASFATRFPGLEARVAAKHVASYLGITPVHLSRLRRRRRESAKARGRGTPPRGSRR
ncbi:MAG: Crp/Fnr family transcriptional regulator [Polyangiales bacterium]